MLKKLYALLPKISDKKPVNSDDSSLLVEIAKAQRAGDPYAHHWYRQLNNTLVCNKCGEVNLGFAIGKTEKCTVHTDHPAN